MNQIQNKSTVEDNVLDIKVTDVIRSIKKQLRYLLSKWWLFLIAGLLGGLYGIYYASKQVAMYEGNLTFALEEGSEGGMGGAFSLAAEFGLNFGSTSGAFSGDNILTIITSRKIIEQTLTCIDTLDGKPITIAEQYYNISGLKKSFDKNPKLNNIKFPPGLAREKYSYLQDSVIFIMYNTILKTGIKAGKPDKKLNQYQIKMKTPSERFSKTFLESLIIQTTNFYTELRSKKSKETLAILEQRVANLRGSVSSAIVTRASTQDANVNPAFSMAQVPLQNKEVDIRVYTGAYAELFKNLELARYNYLKTIPLLQVIDEPRYPLVKTKIGRMKSAIIGGIIMFSITLIILLFIFPLFKKTDFR